MEVTISHTVQTERKTDTIGPVESLTRDGDDVTVSWEVGDDSLYVDATIERVK
jgi:hypothetical protein